MLAPPSHEHYMKMAIAEAERAFELEEVPIGAVVVCKDQVIARAHNLTERLHDFTAHAEMQAFTSASEFLGGKYLDECTLYVTLEPCVMCAGACFNTRIGKIVIGASDTKRGFTHFDGGDRSILHNKTEVIKGIMQDECADLLTQFFASRRQE